MNRLALFAWVMMAVSVPPPPSRFRQVGSRHWRRRERSSRLAPGTSERAPAISSTSRECGGIEPQDRHPGRGEEARVRQAFLNMKADRRVGRDDVARCCPAGGVRHRHVSLPSAGEQNPSRIVGTGALSSRAQLSKSIASIKTTSSRSKGRSTRQPPRSPPSRPRPVWSKRWRRRERSSRPAPGTSEPVPAITSISRECAASIPKPIR